MKIYCKELKKSFDDKESMFKELAQSQELIIDAKKAEVYKSVEKGLQIVTSQNDIQKAIESESNKGLKFDNNYYYFVVNSANILDSHDDMHVDGNWNQTVKSLQGKVYLVFDHSLKRGDIIAMRKDIEMITAKIPFSLLGKSYDGETYCLIYKVAKNKIVNKEAKEWLEDGHELEASVRMQYVKIEPAYNSTNTEFSKQKATYDEYYPLIANKDDFESIEYFWVIKEAKNVYESSLVLFGSNSATGMINNENKEEAVEDTSETKEQLKDTQNETEQVSKRKLSII